MKISELSVNNINNLSCSIEEDSSIGIGGLSGSGKSTFCTAVYSESIRRIITLLPKSEYRFLFGDCLGSNCSAAKIDEMPLVFYLKKNGFSSNPRSTLGTHSGLYKKIRMQFAEKYDKAPEFFSFNNSIMWCQECKGRGSTSGNICKSCEGKRYNKEISDYTVTVSGTEKSIDEVNSMSIIELYNNANDFKFNEVDIKKLSNLIHLGLPYLSLDRIMSTLSGGETIRVFLSEFMASCEGALLILDEISTGLDKESLLVVLKELSELADKNQLWFIDHSDTVLFSTQRQLYFGPGSGKNGGTIVSESPRPAPVYPEVSVVENSEYYNFRSLNKRNINIEELNIHKGRITTVTGESGCGKSTLVNECMIPYFQKKYKDASLIVIGQDRNQSITSKSTIATFLNLKKILNKYDDTYQHLTLADSLITLKKEKSLCSVIQMLVDLGLEYLTLDRKIQTLSTGEFQCVHLVAKLFELENKELLIVLDEPSKGLSQNILNLFMQRIRNILLEYNATILAIEHNEYILNCSDYIIDFGKRTTDEITKISTISVKEWKNRKNNVDNKLLKISCKNKKVKNGITHISDNVDKIYSSYENAFRGGILKSFSSTAQWIYKDYNAENIMPVISIDLEEKIYSENTFVFELCSVINTIIEHGKTEYYDSFDYYNTDNLCECCKGTGKIESFDYSTLIDNGSAGIWDGLFNSDIMKELKRYNYSKIKFLFKEIKKESKLDLSKPLSDMTPEEKNAFLFGYWKNTFYDPNKKTQRRWYGILHLISKYMRSSSSKFKTVIKDTKEDIVCPICNGFLLNHSTAIEFEGTDLHSILRSKFIENKNFFDAVPQMKDIINIIGSEHSLMEDVSKFTVAEQVQLKIAEIMNAKFTGFKIVIKNSAPYDNLIHSMIDQIALKNEVLLLDWDNISETTEELLEKLNRNKVKSSSFIHEIFGYKKISTSINSIRKKYPCEYCKGSGVLKDESIFEGVDVTKTPCMACGTHGINSVGMMEKVENIPVSVWLNGNMADIKNDIPDTVKDIPLCTKISDLNKHHLSSIIMYLGEK